MKAKATDYVVFDVETTGLSPLKGDRIVEIAAIRMKGMKVVDTYQTLINPGRELPLEAQNIHNITQEMIEKAPHSDEVLPHLIDFIGGACLVGHNIKFDLDFLCYELALHGRKLREETPAIDTLKMSKNLLPQIKGHRLTNLALNFGIPTDVTHRALADAKITLSLFCRLLDVAEDHGIKTYQELYHQYSVPKPNFKLQNKMQDILF